MLGAASPIVALPFPINSCDVRSSAGGLLSAGDLYPAIVVIEIVEDGVHLGKRDIGRSVAVEGWGPGGTGLRVNRREARVVCRHVDDDRWRGAPQIAEELSDLVGLRVARV